MEESTSRVPPTLHQPTAGIIKRLRLENFMCHSKHETDFGSHVNFITGQNGSGKSAVLTALCVAFGCRAKGTQRASSLKDFIKTGASNAVIQVEIQNEGEDAFKPDIYGDVIIVERRISESTSSTTLKDHQGRKIVSRKAELLEIVEHFNVGSLSDNTAFLNVLSRINLTSFELVLILCCIIDVENPCVIMTQDKSREFLHSGNNKDKFKQVNDLLESISKEIIVAHDIVEELEAAIRPIEKELNELQVKIKTMEHVEQISIQIQQLKKKLAWSWVYDVDKQLEEQNIKIEKLKNRIPTCQAKIDQQLHRIEKLMESCSEKRAEIKSMLATASQVNQMKENLNQSVSMRESSLWLPYHSSLENLLPYHLSRLITPYNKLQNACIVDNTWSAEESDKEEKLKWLKNEVHAADLELKRLKDEDAAMMDCIRRQNEEIRKIADQDADEKVFKIRDHEKNRHAITCRIRDLQQHQSNKITVFGGDKVINLLRIIERNHLKFKMPPIGPIGAHLKLLHGNKWAVALEYAIGKLLNSFIVTDHTDFRLLKQCAKEANYGHLQIIIYDFSTPRLMMPQHMLPDTEHPSVLSVLQCENHTVINVLVDLGNVERQVLVNDYETGKVVAFERRVRNLKEVYAANGCRIRCLLTLSKSLNDSVLGFVPCCSHALWNWFSRGSVQTVLPPNKRQRTGRLCGSFEDEIEKLHAEADDELKAADDCKRIKRAAEVKLEELDKKVNSIKVPFVKRALSQVSFVTGQPLGYFCYWPLFAFTHHVLVWWAAEQVRPGILFDRYAILGDDVLITDPLVVEQYRLGLQRLGVQISTHQSLISSTGAVEFAKPFLVKDMRVNLSPVSMKALCGFHHPHGYYRFISWGWSEGCNFKQCLQQKGCEAAGKADALKVKFDKLCESANVEIAALEKSECELVEIEKQLDSAKKAKEHYEGVMKNKVLLDIKEAEEHYLELTKRREESVEKASIICSQNELDSLGGCDGNTPEQISAQVERLNQTHKRESQRHDIIILIDVFMYSESIDDLRMLYKKKERKIMKRQQVYKTLRQKLDACQRALELRQRKFQRNATYLKHQLSWKFNGHLRKKGISGLIKVNYEDKTLMIEVQMPQDASNRAVRDTRGLSGGERSFSTLCFALALHEMTEAAFRAMDEFDVFMDAVSRKISLDTLVDFAEAHGSQWIFITPHDTSMVRAGDRIKKMQMAAPRS
ncbi:hypothetical protein Fmac_022778 [Flemingia macrophylla]|uniref:RecF/RecN/SMC N-terminal domain-containing protein n=1 Tax=Flemingia macrophylla TaxID=520843 RepID=A0ABD1M0P0_9FABA